MQIQDKCSFEWAKKLQDAGYKKPETYEAGQVYYDRVGRPIIIACVFHSGLLQTVNAKTHDGGRVMNVPDGCVYAPGVSELMKGLSGIDIVHNTDGKNLNDLFTAKVEGHSDYYKEYSKSNILCDALAEAWIENNKRESDEQI